MSYRYSPLFAILLSCSLDNSQSAQSPISNVVHGTANEPRSAETTFAIIDGALGVIVTSDAYQFGTKIDVFNGSGEKLESVQLDEEYQKMTLRCLSMDNQNYQVRLEDDKIGFVKRDNQNVKFQSWDQHVLSVFSVGFDESKNPLFETPSSQGTKLQKLEDQNYLPVQIKDEWLQVRWGEEGDWKYGWIRWRENQTLLVELFYFA